MIMEYVKARASELSTKVGALLGAAAAAAVVASALVHPWDYVSFGAALGLVLIPEKRA